MSSNEELAMLAQSGDKQAVATLWEQVVKLCNLLSVRFISKFPGQCIACGITHEDLIQECFLALSESVQAYKPENEYKFTTYLYRYVLNHFNALSGHRTERAKNEPINNARSLHDTVPGAEDVTLLDALPDESAQEDFENAIEREYLRELHGALDETMSRALTPEQGHVIRLYYYGGQTLNAIGTAIGQTTGQIRQLKNASLRQMRKPQNAKNLYPFVEWSGRFYAGSLSSFKANQASNIELIIERREERLQRERERFGCTLSELKQDSNKRGIFRFND